LKLSNIKTILKVKLLIIIWFKKRKEERGFPREKLRKPLRKKPRKL